MLHCPVAPYFHRAGSGQKSKIAMTPPVLLESYTLVRCRKRPQRFRQHLVRLNCCGEIGLKKLLCCHLPFAACTLHNGGPTQREKEQWNLFRWVCMCQASPHRSLISCLRVSNICKWRMNEPRTRVLYSISFNLPPPHHRANFPKCSY